MAYCTAQDVIDFCSWPRFGTFSAAAQQGFLDAASCQINGALWRPYGFMQQTATETFSGSQRQSLWLSLLPVIAVGSVTIDGNPVDDTSGYGWTVDLGTGRLTRGTGHYEPRFAWRWPAGSDNVAVQYFGGYLTLPADLVMATAFMVRYLAERGRVPGVFSQESLGDWSGTLAPVVGPDSLPPHVMALVAHYDRRSFA